MLRKASNFLSQINEVVGRATAWLTAILMILMCYNVLQRYFFGNIIAWRTELEWHLFAAVFLLGAAYTMREDANVRVDVFYERMNPQKKAWVNILGTLIFVIPMCSLILFSSYDFVTYSYKIQEISNDPGGLPYRFAFKALLPIGYFLILIQSLAMLSRNIRILAGDTVSIADTPAHQEKL